jgi:hypothetical protein
VFNLSQYTFGQAIASEHDDWLERMGEAFEVLFLFGT